MDQFYTNFAEAFFRMNHDQITVLRDTYKENFSVYFTPEERNTLTREFVKMLKADTQDLVQYASESIRTESYRKLLKELDEKLIPVLNAELVFHVKDESLKEGQDFTKSKYYVNWKNVKENSPYLNGEKLFNDPDFRTPMRFSEAREPLFLPYLKNGEKVDPKAYYPYTDNFLPKPMGGDVVFRCTVYHYLMMGAPEYIFFKDPYAKDYKKAPRLEGAIQLPDIPSPRLNSKNKYELPVKKIDVEVVIPFSQEPEYYWFDHADAVYFGDLTAGSFASILYGSLAGLQGSGLNIGKDGTLTFAGKSTYSQEIMHDSEYMKRQAAGGVPVTNGMVCGSISDPCVKEQIVLSGDLTLNLSGTYNPVKEKGSAVLSAVLTGDESGTKYMASGSGNYKNAYYVTFTGQTENIQITDTNKSRQICLFFDGIQLNYSKTKDGIIAEEESRTGGMTLCFSPAE